MGYQLRPADALTSYPGVSNYALDIHGVRFAVATAHDDQSAAPWKECDGHGPVRDRDGYKRPGERPMGDYYYDWAEATKIAKRDGWGVAEHQRPDNWDQLTPAQRTALAVERDFDYLLGWVEDAWEYTVVGVAFWPQGMEVDDLGFDYCGGVESLDAYHETFAIEAALEMMRSSTEIRHAAAYAVHLMENEK